MPIAAADPSYRNLSPQMSKMMDQLQKGYYSFLPSETWTPSVNLYETDQAYVVCVDLAGVEKEKIDVEVVQQKLVLKGARRVPACTPRKHADEGPRMKVHLMEIDHGAFAREVELPVNIMKEKIAAKYVDGLLWIELPKK
jgi:HSP20 family protein